MNDKNKNRIERLRERALSPYFSFDGVYADFLIRYEENADLGAIEDRYADAYAYALSKLQPLTLGETLISTEENTEEDTSIVPTNRII